MSPPSSSFPLPHVLTMMSYDPEHSFGQLWSPIPAASPPNPQSRPQHGSMKNRKDLDSAQVPLSNNKNISVLWTLCSAQIQNLTPY